jgi:hypothetical protein
MKAFAVRLVGVSEATAKECYVLGLGERNEPDQGEHLLLQGQAEHADADDEGEEYCLVTPSGVSYAPALAWGLRARSLVIRLSDKAARQLRVDGGFDLDLHGLSDEEVKTIEAGLARVFVGVPRDDSIVDAGRV